jgi:hypothetical protein
MPAELVRVVNAWAALPRALQAAVLALVETVAPAAADGLAAGPDESSTQ